MSLGGRHGRPGLAALAALLALPALLAKAQEELSPSEIERLIQAEFPEGFDPSRAVVRGQRALDIATAGVETRYFRIQGDYASLGVPMEELGPLFDEVFEYVRDRVGLPPDAVSQSAMAKIPVSIQPPSAGAIVMKCPQRGAAGVGSANGGFIAIFADATTSRAQLIGVLAHEIGHVLMPRVLGGLYFTDGQMHEGYATWAGGRYVLDWLGVDSLQTIVARQLADGTYASLLATLGDYYAPVGEVVARDVTDAECFARRDLVYTRWAGFIEYLVERDGPATFLALLRSGGRFLSRTEALAELQTAFAEAREAPASVEPPSMPPMPRGLQYEEVYGLDLAALEAAWLESLKDADKN